VIKNISRHHEILLVNTQLRERLLVYNALGLSMSYLVENPNTGILSDASRLTYEYLVLAMEIIDNYATLSADEFTDMSADEKLHVRNLSILCRPDCKLRENTRLTNVSQVVPEMYTKLQEMNQNLRLLTADHYMPRQSRLQDRWN
jgi:hypothetical protein